MAIKNLNLSVDDVTFDPHGIHHKGAGLHIRQMSVPSGKTSITHKHDEDHLSILANGSCVMTSDEGSASYVGPACILVKRNIQYAITATSDLVWFCISDISGVDDSLVSLGD